MCGNEIFAFLAYIVPFEKSLDNGCTGGRTSYAVFLEGIPKFIIVHEFARSLHCPQQSRFRIRFRRFGPYFLDHRLVRSGLPQLERRQYGIFLRLFRCFSLCCLLFRIVRIRLLLFKHAPSRFQYHFAGCLEFQFPCLAVYGRGGYFAIRIECLNKTPRHKVINHPFFLAQIGSRHSCRYNCVVVSHFRIVEDTLALGQFLAFERGRKLGISLKTVEYAGDLGVDVIAEEGSIHSRICSHFLFIEGLYEFECLVGTEAIAFVAVHLQGCKVVETGRKLLALLLSQCSDCEVFVLDDLKESISIIPGFEPPLGTSEEYFPVHGFELPGLLRFEIFDFILAVDYQCQGRRLHPSYRQHFAVPSIASAVFERIESGRIHPQQPVSYSPA